MGWERCEEVEGLGVAHTGAAVDERVLEDGRGDAVPPEERVEGAIKLFVALELLVWRDNIGSDVHVAELSNDQNEVNQVVKLVAPLGTSSELKDHDQGGGLKYILGET